MTPKRATRGFTLLELLITVAIAAVLLTLGVPGFLEMLDKRRIVGAAETIYSELQLARTQAIELNQPVSVVVTKTTASDWCYGVTNKNTCDCNAPDGDAAACEILTDLDLDGDTDGANESPYRVFNASDFKDVTLTSPSANGTTVLTFSPLRMTAGGTNDTLEFTSGKGKVIRVVISTMGRVRSCSPEGSTQVSGYADSNGASPNC